MNNTEFMNIYENKTHNMTYEIFNKYNNWIKNTIIKAKKTTIINVDFKENYLTYHIGTSIYHVDINDFIFREIKKFSLYLSNPSALKNWKGFYTDNRIFITQEIIKYVNLLIPANISEKLHQEHNKFNKNECTLNFEVIAKDKINSYLLRQKLAYDCKEIEEHFWYVQKGYNITIVSDIPIYTPINSSGLFSYNNFYHLDLHNINFSYTKDFTMAFYVSKCNSIDFGKKPKTSSLLNMESMFENAQLRILDLRNWDLSHVRNMKSFCTTSRLEELYFNPNTPSLEQIAFAFYRTNLKKHNILEMNMSNVVDINKRFG